MCCHLPVSIKVQLLIKLPAVYKLGDAGLSESAGWSSRVQQANQIQIWPLGAGSTQKSCCLPASGIGAGPNTGKIELAFQSLPRNYTTQTLSICLRCPRVTVPPLKPRVSFYAGPLSRCLGLSQPSVWSESPLFLIARSCGSSLLTTSTLGWGTCCWRLGSLAPSWGNSVAEISLPIFICHTEVWGLPVSHLCPS